jgi:hypothetical protein
MQFIVLILAVIGFLAVMRLAGRAGLGLMVRGVEVFLAKEVGQTHARRGDLTAWNAAEAARTSALRGRLGALALFTTCVGLLAVPPFTPWTAAVYAAYAPLWLLAPRKRA